MKVYYLPLDSSPWSPADERLLSSVSGRRQERIKKYAYDDGRRLSLYAALVTRMGISLQTGIPAASLAFQAESGHKPICLTAPGLDFSFSHTKHAILCCISGEAPVGADIERLRPVPIKIAERFFHKEETEYVWNGSDKEQSLRFFEIWTKKEAYSKQIGLGFGLSPQSYNTLSPELASRLHTWRQDGYLCSVCCEKPSPLEIITVTEETIQKFFHPCG